jgi:DUF917 family protein
MPVREAKQILSLGTIGRSLALGELLENQDLEGCDAFLMRLGGASLGTGVVCQCEFALNAEAGFLTGYYEIEEPSGRKLRVIVKNENLVCLERDQVVLTCPDLILALDLEKMEGVHNSEMRTGQQVRLYSLPAEKRWQTSKARCIGGPRSAGLDFPSVCIPETE